jgi:hypothetical protein
MNYNMERVEQLNQRITERNATSTIPSFYFSPRPVPTKYTTMPIVDNIPLSKVNIEYQKPYNTTENYLPASSAPWSGFSANVDVETKLRYEKEYIPSSKSSMYVKPNIPSTHTTQPFPELFAQLVLSDKPSTFKDKHLFYNSTSEKINY